MRRNVLGGIGLVLVMVLLVFVLGFFFTNVGRKNVPAAQPSPSSGAPQQPPNVPRVESQLWGQRVKLADDVRAPRLALSPDNSKIAYVTISPPPAPPTSPLATAVPGRSTQKASLVILDAGTGKVLFREDDTAASYLIEWSPDNETLAYVSNTNNNKNRAIATVRFDGSARKELLSPDRFQLISPPAWSPDGKMIAFTSKNVVGNVDSESFLWAMNSDGTNLRNLLGGRSQEVGRLVGKPVGVLEGVTWARDGSKLLFGAGFASQANALEAEQSMLFTISPTGGAPAPMSLSFANVHKMMFSPDGQSILYLRSLSEPDKPGFWLWAAKADGQAAASLNIGGKGVGIPDPVGWSPDGTRVVYISGPPRNEGLWVADSDGRNAVELVTRAVGEYITNAGISGDGRALAFIKVDKAGKLELWVAR